MHIGSCAVLLIFGFSFGLECYLDAELALSAIVGGGGLGTLDSCTSFRSTAGDVSGGSDGLYLLGRIYLYVLCTMGEYCYVDDYTQYTHKEITKYNLPRIFLKSRATFTDAPIVPVWLKRLFEECWPWTPCTGLPSKHLHNWVRKFVIYVYIAC